MYADKKYPFRYIILCKRGEMGHDGIGIANSLKYGIKKGKFIGDRL
jgi:hypothetical protein